MVIESEATGECPAAIARVNGCFGSKAAAPTVPHDLRPRPRPLPSPHPRRKHPRHSRRHDRRRQPAQRPQQRLQRERPPACEKLGRTRRMAMVILTM